MPSAAAFRPASWLAGKTSVPTVPPTPTKAPPTPKVAKAVRPRRARRQPGLFTLCLLGLVAAYLLRPGPAGTLVVYATPNVPGRITVDGERAGVPGERLQIPVGTHRLGYEADGWTAAGRQVRVTANEQRVITIVLSPVPAVLVIDLQTPGTTLRLDDRGVDARPGGLRVPAGRHRLTAMRPGYATSSQDVELTRGERRVVTVALAPIVARDVTRTAVFGAWSEPVALPPHTVFTVAASGRVRLRVGQEIVLLQPGSTTNLGDVRGQSLQVEAVDDQPAEVHVYLKPEG